MDASEVIERSWSHFLTRDDEGFALWGVDQDSEHPLLTFPAGPVGEERALATFHIRSRETARVRRFGVAAIIGGAIFLLTNLAEMALDVFPIDPPETANLFTPENLSYKIQAVLLGVEGVGYAILLVSVGWYVVAWLQRRWRREG